MSVQRFFKGKRKCSLHGQTLTMEQSWHGTGTFKQGESGGVGWGEGKEGAVNLNLA